MSKYGHRPHNWFEAIVNKIGGEERAEQFLKGELIVSAPTWREQDGIIYFTVTSDGTTGPEWIERLEKKGFHVGDYAKQLLRSSDCKQTSGVTTEVAVLKSILFEDKDRITHNIRAKAEKRKLTRPNAEISCLIREKFTDEDIAEMGLTWIIIMHKPINDSDGNPNLLSANRGSDSRCLNAFHGSPDVRWSRGDGFAFVVSPACRA